MVTPQLSGRWKRPRPSSNVVGKMPNSGARFAWDLTPASSLRTENVGLTPVTSNRLPATAVRALDSYADTVLTCPPRLARSGGVHLLSASGRGLPGWNGYTLPVVGLSLAPGAGVACRPDILERTRSRHGS